MSDEMYQTAAAMNRELRARYAAAIANLQRHRDFPLTGSKPHLIEVPDSYATTSTRLMIVGQEPLGWGGNEQLNAAELMRGYTNFDLGQGYRGSPFWNASHTIARAVLPAAETSPCFLWSNLVKLDVGQKRPPAEIEDVISAARLLPIEIEVCKPTVVVFFTGPQYEDRLLKTFPDARVEPIEERWLGRVVHPSLPYASFRTYHPRYLRMRKRWDVVPRIIELSAQTSTEIAS